MKFEVSTLTNTPIHMTYCVMCIGENMPLLSRQCPGLNSGRWATVGAVYFDTLMFVFAESSK